MIWRARSSSWLSSVLLAPRLTKLQVSWTGGWRGCTHHCSHLGSLPSQSHSVWSGGQRSTNDGPVSHKYICVYIYYYIHTVLATLWAPPLAEAQRYSTSNEIHDGIIFDFYLRLPHISLVYRFEFRPENEIRHYHIWKVIPYNGKLSREKTFANFKVL